MAGLLGNVPKSEYSGGLLGAFLKQYSDGILGGPELMSKTAPSVYRTLPMSPNVDDRRGDILSLSDLAQRASIAIAGRPLFGNNDAEFKRSFPPTSAYGNDIEGAVRNIQFEKILDDLWRKQDSKTRLEQWFRSIEGAK